MYFAGVYLKSFGHCKVLNWKNSVYTDFDRKELTHNGRVLAAVEVPTIRKIEALILVRGRNVHEVQNKLESLSAWLYGAGTAKLCHETDLSRYFYARCTQVSIPEYNGPSARCTVTFTCADHRLFSSKDDQPVIWEENNMSNFTFAGMHCLNDMGCLFVKDAEPVVPAVNAHVYEISGMSGTLRYNTGNPILRETYLSGTLYFVKNTPGGRMYETEITNKRHEVAAWLINAERASLILDNDINRSYQAEVVTETVLTRSQWINGGMKVKFVLQPVSESVDETRASAEIITVANEKQTVDVSSLTPYGISYETPIVLTLVHTGGEPISDLVLGYNVNGKENILHLNHENFSMSENTVVIIDSQNGWIRVDGADGMPYLKTGDFPVISANGSNYLSITTDAAASMSVNIVCKVRWVG